MYVGTLRRFIEAVGSELEIVARLPDHVVKIRNCSDLNERERGRHLPCLRPYFPRAPWVQDADHRLLPLLRWDCTL